MLPDPSEPIAASGDLLRAAQAGDRASFDELLRRSQPRLLRLVRARMGSVLRGIEDSADLAQSAMVEAVRALPRFQYTGPGSFLRWLSTIVESKIRHHVRDLQRQRRDPARLAAETPTDIVAAAASPSEAAVAGELEQRYAAALKSLPPADQEVLLLHLDLGCSYEEIATATAAPSGEAVRKRIARGLVRLGQAMGEAPRGQAPRRDADAP
jgi:RNA polymerase sigma factor (sigma-70 family)